MKQEIIEQTGEVLEVNESVVKEAKETLAEARKAKFKTALEKSKKVAKEVAKYSIPAVVVGVVMSAKQKLDQTDQTVVDVIEGEFEEVKDKVEEHVEEESGE